MNIFEKGCQRYVRDPLTGDIVKFDSEVHGPGKVSEDQDVAEHDRPRPTPVGQIVVI